MINSFYDMREILCLMDFDKGTHNQQSIRKARLKNNRAKAQKRKKKK
jgi:hypothetical protein